MKNKIYILLLLIIASCASKQKSVEQTFWVNSTKVTCTGVAPMLCLEVQKGENINPNKWELFYNTIEGFTFIPGNIYKLKVAVEDLNPKTIPADASSKKYKLVEVISKKIDVKLHLHDIWVATHLNGEEIQIKNERSRPQMEIKVADKKVLGKGVCNRFFGSIETVTETDLVFSDKMGNTKMMCPNISLEDNFFKALLAVKTYKIGNTNLYLFNKDKKEIVRFKKID